MIRALLAGTKTQTRRVIKSPWFTIAMCETSNPPHLRYSEFRSTKGQGRYECGSGPFSAASKNDQQYAATFCPHGKKGDRLWCRETFSIGESAPYDDGKTDKVPTYRCDWQFPDSARVIWKPSIFMPRWASRITLEVDSVRVERLHDISEEDAIAEGVEYTLTEEDAKARAISGFDPYGVRPSSAILPVEAYRTLWEDINGARSWDKSPYVWVISFHRIKP